MRRTLRVPLALISCPAARIAGTAAGLVLVARSIDLRVAAHGLRDADPTLVLIGFALTGLGLAGAVLAWGLLLHADGHNLAWGRLGGLYLQGMFAGQLTPAGIAGDGLRAAGVTHQTGYGDAVASLLGSRLATTLVMSVWALAGAVLLRSWFGTSGLLAGLGFLLVVSGIWAVLLHGDRLTTRLRASRRVSIRRCGELLMPVASALAGYRNRPGLLGRLMLVAGIGWGLNLAALAVFAHALDVPAGWSIFAVATPVSLVATLAPFSLNGIGLREGALVGMLAHAGASSSHAAVLAILIDLQTIPFVICGAVLWSRIGRRRGRAGEARDLPSAPERGTVVG